MEVRVLIQEATGACLTKTNGARTYSAAIGFKFCNLLRGWGVRAVDRQFVARKCDIALNLCVDLAFSRKSLVRGYVSFLVMIHFVKKTAVWNLRSQGIYPGRYLLKAKYGSLDP